MITIGTGVGTAVLFDGRPLTGRSGVIGEFGDLHYGEGTFEDACSGAALTRAAYERGFTDPRAVFTQPALRDVHDRAFTALGIILKTVTTAYEPEAIVLGGGVAHSLTAWCDPFVRQLAEITPEPPEVLITQLGDDAGALGAMHLAKEAHLLVA
jgi:predicted NBD/HSP70 family sugar kinase